MLFILPPFLADLLAFVGATDPADLRPLITPVTTELVVADAVIDAEKGDVTGLVTLILAVEARKSERSVHAINWYVGGRRWGQGGQVGAGGGAWLVRAIRAVAIVVVDF